MVNISNLTFKYKEKKTLFEKLNLQLSPGPIATEEKIIVISTHQVRDLDNLIDSMIVLNENQIVFNEKLDEVSTKLSFISYSDYEKPENILYDEPSFAGGNAVITNKSGNPTRVDMEFV